MIKLNILFHVIFGVFAILFFTAMYIKRRELYQLLFGILMAGTFLIYISESQLFRIITGSIEIILCIAAIIALFSARRRASDSSAADQQIVETADDESAEA